MINLIKNNNIYYIEIDGVIDDNFTLNEDEIKMLMDYLYVYSIHELNDNLNMRFSFGDISHKDIYIYIKKNFNVEEVIDFAGIGYDVIDYNNEIIPNIDINNIKQNIHKLALYEGVKYFFKNTKFYNGEILFTGGTSLLLKSEKDGSDYFRFSLDLDFSFYDNKKNINDREILIEIENLGLFITEFLKENGCIVEENSNWRMIKFEYPGYGIAEIKIDWMKNFNLNYEIIELDNVQILKASNEDIIANKLLRLNERDLADILFLYQKLNFNNLINSLEAKSYNKYGDQLKFLSYVKNIWNKNSSNKLVNELLKYYNL